MNQNQNEFGPVIDAVAGISCDTCAYQENLRYCNLRGHHIAGIDRARCSDWINKSLLKIGKIE